MRILKRGAVTLACWLLKQELDMQQRTKLVNAMLDANNAVPLSDIIVSTEHGLFVEGRAVDIETAARLRTAADAMTENYARKFVLEQVASIAGRRGVTEADEPVKLLFYRAALWWGKVENQYYQILAQRPGISELD